jgi:F-type H+-transporting ATPase subunit b
MKKRGLKALFPKTMALALAAMIAASPAMSEEKAQAAFSSSAEHLSQDIATTLEAESPAVPHDEVGFPQLKQTHTYASQVFWLAIAFVLMYLSMSKLALPRVGTVFDLRKKYVADNLGEAEHLTQAAETIRAAYKKKLAAAHEQAREALYAAESSMAAKLASEELHFSENMRLRVAKTDRDIAFAKEEALRTIADVSAEAAADITQRITGVSISKLDARKAVDAAMKEG